MKAMASMSDCHVGRDRSIPGLSNTLCAMLAIYLFVINRDGTNTPTQQPQGTKRLLRKNSGIHRTPR